MTADDINRAIWRMAHEIIERNHGVSGVMLVGLQTGGVSIAQQLAVTNLGRRLSIDEMRSLLASTGVIVNDGDDENDNVAHTGLNFPRVNVCRTADI